MKTLLSFVLNRAVLRAAAALLAGYLLVGSSSAVAGYLYVGDYSQSRDLSFFA